MAKYHRRGNYKHRKGGGVSGWKSKRKPKKKSALVRQTEQNRKAIKELKETREVKYERQMVATKGNNFNGQILVSQQVDNFGLAMDSETWVANGGQQYLQPAYLSSYQPLWVCPTGIDAQGVTAGTRIGDDVTMRSLVIKGTMIGGKSQNNGGIYAATPQKQTLHMYVVLDKSPVGENTSSPPVFNVSCSPAQTFTYQPAWNNTLPAGQSTTTFRQLGQHLKSMINGSKNPSGLPTTLAQKDLLNLSYWSKDEGGISELDRFKILKHCKYHCDQQSPEAGTGAPPAGIPTVRPQKSQRDFSETIKGNYKFSFPNSTASLPDNQRIYLVFVSETPTVRYNTNSGIGNPPDNYVTAPRVTLTCSFNYTDA